MRRTYTHYSVVFGFLIGLLVFLKTNIVLGVIAGLAVSVIAYVLIKALEDGLDAAGHILIDKISELIGRKR